MWSPEPNDPNSDGTTMNTLSACINKAVKTGFTDNFSVTPNGLRSGTTERHFRPEDVSVINFYRFEGQSDPADNAILYVIETADGLRGTLIDAYGPYADAGVNKFMKEVEDIRKKESPRKG